MIVTAEMGEQDGYFTITEKQLSDKIKGGWAGQVIGCTYGGPTEFHYNGLMIDDSVDIPWDTSRVQWYFDHEPGLYDDIYMDLTFVDVFEKKGLNASDMDHANAIAHSEYKLWHANQAARYNILQGIYPPQSGHWMNNPHADDIDFQIEADFAGLMSPGMPNVSSEICDKIGHIMNYGDGWYGGVYVGAMYSLAFVSNDMQYIVSEALKAIPSESTFYQCINDILTWKNKYPHNWKETWTECQKKWAFDTGCPDGVYMPFDIDAKLNAAYIVIGLLYGEGDLRKTMDISARCGQDSDCNPANAAGILGTMLGYQAIPEEFHEALIAVEDRDFKYTTMSLNDVYNIGNQQALENLKLHGAKIQHGTISIPSQPIKAVTFEKAFAGLQPDERFKISKKLDKFNTEVVISFKGIGFAITGSVISTEKQTLNHYTAEIELVIDGKSTGSFKMPAADISRRTDVSWAYNLSEGSHNITILLHNPDPKYRIDLYDMITYIPAVK